MEVNCNCSMVGCILEWLRSRETSKSGELVEQLVGSLLRRDDKFIEVDCKVSRLGDFEGRGFEITNLYGEVNVF